MRPNYKGVNLGGWLVLEKWMTPELFEGLEAKDEYSFCLELGSDEARLRLEKHWQTFITKEDFIWIKNHGLNAVRIPVGYWNFEDEEPFISSVEYLDQALEWSEEIGLSVVISLHAAPGSQNGWDHSGRSGEIHWHKDSESILRTLAVLEKMVERYGNKSAVVGIGLLNEPHWDIPVSTLLDFYKKGYELIRRKVGERMVVIFDDNFRNPNWKKIFAEHELKNVLIDLHLYQCFSDEAKKLDIAGHLEKTYIVWQSLIEDLQQFVPVVVGEWSLGLDNKSLEGLDGVERLEALKSYAEAQTSVFEQAAGYFFWNYKVDAESMKGGWSYRDLVEGGIMQKSDSV